MGYTGHGELHVPHKCFSKTTNEEEDCGQNSRFVPALSIPYDSDGFVTMQDGTTKKWVKWLDKEIRFKHDTSATAELKGITLGDASGGPRRGLLCHADAKGLRMRHQAPGVCARVWVLVCVPNGTQCTPRKHGLDQSCAPISIV